MKKKNEDEARRTRLYGAYVIYVNAAVKDGADSGEESRRTVLRHVILRSLECRWSRLRKLSARMWLQWENGCRSPGRLSAGIERKNGH